MQFHAIQWVKNDTFIFIISYRHLFISMQINYVSFNSFMHQIKGMRFNFSSKQLWFVFEGKWNRKKGKLSIIINMDADIREK